MSFGPTTLRIIPNRDNETDNINRNKNKQKRKRIRKNKKLTIAAINARGIKGKIKSLESLLDAYKIDIVLLTETMLKNKEGLNIKGYKWIGKNRKGKNGGGVGILINNKYARSATEITHIDVGENTEVVWIKLDTRPKNLAIGVFYGPQETDQVSKVQETYTDLETQILQLMKDNEILLGGDFNAKLNVNSSEATQEESRNGRTLRAMLTNTNLMPLNLKRENVAWTRVNRKNTAEKSIIDYLLISESSEKYTSDISVDTEGHLRLKGKNETDHNTISMNLRINSPRMATYREQWKINNKQGWRKFNTEMKKEAEKGLGNQEYEEAMKKIKQILTKTVGKQKIRTDKPPKPKSKEVDEARTRMKTAKTKFNKACNHANSEEKQTTKKEYEKAQQNLREALEKLETARTEEKIKRLIAETKISPNIIWQTRRKTKNDTDLEYNTITEEGRVLTEPDETREYIANYFENLYQARPSTPAYEEWTNKIIEKVETLQKDHKQTIITQGSERIELKELHKAIGRLKRRKSLGPDQLPNEIMIEGDKNTRNIILELLNNIHHKEEVPPSWSEGHIKRLYKGKGVKGKCSNERGITLASNVGKVYERILNERIKKIINITDSQAGGIEGNATADHLITLKEVVAKIRKNKKTAYIIFLDVQKAYDKAWLDAILYVLNKNGVEGKNLEMARKMNSNLTAKIQTKFGLTREIEIKDSIRQGGVLSVIEYAALIDEISKELNQRDLGIRINEHEKLGCLLWMDDVALIHDNLEKLQEMMDCTNDIAGRYHIEFGAAKCKVVKIGRGPKSQIKLNDQILEETPAYKYLGEQINSKANLDDHLKEVEGKVIAATQKILTETGHKEFKGMKMRAIWELVETTIIPIITYAAEGWTWNKGERKKAQTLFNQSLKTILHLPKGTPTTILLAETGFQPIEHIVNKKRIMQAQRIKNKHEEKLVRKIAMNKESIWMKDTEETLQKYDLQEEDLEKPKEWLADLVNKKNSAITKEVIEQEATTMTKIKHWNDHTQNNLASRPAYMNKLGRKQCSAILRARSQMLPTKANMKGNQTDMTCRLCKDTDTQETQKHILQDCPTTKEKNLNIEYDEIFQEYDIEKLKSIADKIIEICEIINEM